LSNLLETKGPLLLLDALQTLRHRKVAFKATFAGAPSSGITRDALLARIETLGMTDLVTYVGAVHGRDKEQLFASHDVFVLPTWADAFPLVVIEAMRHGLAVVSTREGAIPDILDEDAGILIEPRDSTALVESLVRLAQ